MTATWQVASTALDHPSVHAVVTPDGVTREMFRDLALVEDRKRIAVDLHDTVVQRLFAAGLALQGALRALPPSPATERIEAAIGVLDDTIRQIRTTILGLDGPGHLGGGLRAEILAVTAEAATTLGFTPRLRLEGPLDAAVDDTVAGHLLAVLREALSNVARHARASRADATVAVAGGHLRIEVRDDGIGPGAGLRPGGRGVVNVAHRAACLGGTMSLLPGTDGRGTALRWWVPLTGASPVR
jgi:signal transduction histidine kinase